MAGSTSLTELYHGHFVLISTFILNFVALGAFNASGMYLDELKKTFPSSGNHLLPLFCTLQIVAGLASSLIGGIAQDILEKRGIGLQWLFFGGGAFMGLGFLFSSLCSTLAGVFLGSILFGIGLGFGGFLSGGVCVLWFEKYRGTMLLIAISGQGIGNVAFAWATAKILNHFRAEMIEDPWRPTMQIMGLLSFALCTMASVAMRIPFDGEVKEYESRNDDNRKGKEKYGSTMVSPRIGARTRVNRKFERISMEKHHVISSHNFNRGSFQGLGNGTLRKFSDFHQGYETIQPANKLLVSNSGLFDTILQSMPIEGEEEEEEDMEKYTLSQLIYSSTSIWLNTFTLIACFPLLNLQVLLPYYISSSNMPESMDGKALVMFGVGYSLSSLLGPVADLIGAWRVLGLSFLNISILFLFWPYCTTAASLETLAFFYGFFSCTNNSMPIIILADAYGQSSPEHILALNGVANIFLFPGFLLGPSLAGWMVEKSGSYDLPAMLSALTTLLGASALLLIPSPDRQQQELQAKKAAMEQ